MRISFSSPVFGKTLLAVLLASLPTQPALADGLDALAAADAKLDRSTIAYDGVSPNKMVCDTTPRVMPDGSWLLVMLAGGDTEPSPRNYIGVTRSLDQGKTWSKLEPLDTGIPREGKTIGQGATELMVLGGRCTLFFSTHSHHWRNDWRTWVMHSDDSGRTWSRPEPAPGRLRERSFLRDHIVARDGRILVPFQHYVGPESESAKPPLERALTNPRNGVLMSGNGGKTWTEHGDIRLTGDDRYFGWAEATIVELADGRISMLIRADKLGGVLYRAESRDGGRTWPAFAEKTDIPNPGSKASMYSLGGDNVALLHNPNPSHRSPLALWISLDGLKTWPYRRVLVPESSDGPKGRINYPDGFVSPDKRWLHFAYDDNRHRAVVYSARLPEMPPPPEARDLSLEPTPTLVAPGPAYTDATLDYAMVIGVDRTPKGRLWAAWVAGGDNDKGLFVAATSDDDGATWTQPRLAIDPADAPDGLRRRALVGNFWTDPTGKLWLFYDQSMGYFDGRAGVWAITCDDPDADKPSWSPPRRIAHGATLNKPLVLRDGEWLLPVSLWTRDRIRPESFRALHTDLDDLRMANVFASTDRGATWARKGGVRVPETDFDEHIMVERKDGELWMLARTRYGLAESTSPDRGATWTPAQPSSIKHINARIHLRRLASGRLLLVKHGTIDERTGVSYPDGFQAPDGRIYIIYDHERSKAREILLARFSEADILAGRMTSPNSAARLLVHKARGGLKP